MPLVAAFSDLSIEDAKEKGFTSEVHDPAMSSLASPTPVAIMHRRQLILSGFAAKCF